MGLLDQIAGSVLGSVGGAAGQNNPLLGMALQLLNNPQMGGLSGLLQKFQAAGLGEHAASWVGTGQNMPVSGDQVTQALGSGPVAEIAQKLGMPQGDVAGQLAQMLPQLINHVTPDGQVPQNQLLEQGLALLKGKLLG